MLSKKDVDFVNKVKSSGPTFNISMGEGGTTKPTIVPMNAFVNVVNTSSSAVEGNASIRRTEDQSFIVDVVLHDIGTRGKIYRALR